MKNLNPFSTHHKPQTTNYPPLTSHLLPLTSFLLFAFFLFGTLNAQSIYQLPNPGFEVWGIDEGGTNGSTGPVPEGFNSYHSGYCTTTILVGTCQGVATRCEQSTDTRPGTTGQYSLRLFSNTVALGVRANGNVTTGRINMGSTTPANNENHNSVIVGNPKFCQEITGTPDSLSFWVKYTPGRTGTSGGINNTTDTGRIHVVIHGTDNAIGNATKLYRDKADLGNLNAWYGRALGEMLQTNGQWIKMQVPFEYPGNNITTLPNGNRYLLLSMTTHAKPGGGANNADQIWFDDIEFIYSAWLADLKVNGQTIEGFHKNLLTYGGPVLSNCLPGECDFPYQPSDFSWTTEVADATVEVTNVEGPDGDADGGYTSILVTAEDGVTQKEYRVYYYTNRSDDNKILSLSYSVGDITDISVPDFVPTQNNYNITITNPEETNIPQIEESSIILSHPAAIIQRIEQPTSMYSNGLVVVQAENFSLRSYNFVFSKVASTNKNLNWIKVGGTVIAGFDPNILNYDYSITTCTTSIPAVDYELSSDWATAAVTPATLSNRTTTIKVTAQNGDTVSYKVNFLFTNNNTSILGYRLNTTNVNSAFNAGNDYTHTNTGSFTALQTVNQPTTASQIGCSGQTYSISSPTVWFPDTNKIVVKAMNLVDTQLYKVVLKNTNCYVATGNNNGFRYNYNGLVNQNTAISLSTSSSGGNNNNNPFTTAAVTLPVGPPTPPELVVYGLTVPAGAGQPTYTIVQPAHRNDTAVVTLTANDGTTQKIYRVPFKATLSTDATLQTITSNGVQVPGFNPATENYTLIFPSSVTELPEIDYAPTFQWLPEGNIVVTEATSWTESTIIEVTAENGTTTKTYTINYYSVPQEIDAYLIDIRYANVSIPGFNPLTYHYTVNIPYSDPLPPVLTPISSSPTALVFQSEPLTTEPYTIKILVYSEDMSVYEIYSVDFNRVKNTNPYLADIQVNGVSLPDFVSQEFDYEYELSYTVFDAPEVTAIPIYPYANVEIEQINSVNGTVLINITAEDDTFTATYTLDISRQLSPINTIESIVYEYDEQEYELEIPANQTVVQIILPVETEGIPELTEVFLTDFRSEYIIEEQPDEDNNFTATVAVTAEDETEENYYFVFERTLSSSTLITMIYVDGNPLQGFDPNVYDYSIILPFNYSQISNVTATAAWAGTSVQITQLGQQPFGTATVLVLSEDGEFYKTYTIEFQRKGTPNLLSLSYNLDGTSISVPGFSPTIFTYNIQLPLATTATPVLEYLEEDNRCEIEVVQPDSPNGSGFITLTTWNEDATETYTVNFTVLVSTDASLFDLLVDDETIEGFNPNVLNYTIEYEYGKEDLPVVTAIATQIDAETEIENISEYPGVATVAVTAGDMVTTRTYTISFSVEPGNNTYLMDLIIYDNTLYGFDKNIYSYEVMMDYGTTEFPAVNAVPEDSRSVVVIVQPTLEEPTAVITVTALNGDVATYEIFFNIKKNPNAQAKMIYVDWKELEDFMPSQLNYTVNLPAGYLGQPFVAVDLMNPNATWKYIEPQTFPAVGQVVVTAEDGENHLTYEINYTIATSITTFGDETVIHVYPNPSSDIIYFEISEMNDISTLEIFSYDGKRVAIHNLNGGNNPIQINELANGIYFYKIFTNNTMIGAGKFMKK